MATVSERARPRRSLLFVPGSRPEMFDKALATSADIVCVDLEDAVAPALKADARVAAFDFLGAGAQQRVERAVRINPVRTAEGLRDLAHLTSGPPLLEGLLVMTKANDPEEVAIVADLLMEHGSSLGIVPLIETARGLDAAMEIASASPRVVSLLFGAVDLAAELGVPVAHEPLLYARSRVVHAARRAAVGAFDVPCLDFKNLDLLREESQRAQTLGFTGKAVLHPSNIAVVNACFSPSAADIEKATAIVAAFNASPTGLAVLDGKLVERPVVRAMELVLARAAAVAASI
jgi:citrate lyase subunit beta/citryl-CoA lyase/(S)-citramalyl-CoA lyase